MKKSEESSKTREKWLKYKLDSLWVAYKKARNSYYAAPNVNKKSVLRHKIQDCDSDSKKLHKLVSNLTTKTIDNPLPPGLTNNQQANSFADYFENKILAIRKMFESKEQYQSEPRDIPKL